MTFFLQILFALVVVVASSLYVFSKTQDNEDVQSWSDIQVTIPIAKKIDLTVNGTFRIGKNVTRPSEARFGSGFVYKPIKSFAAGASYLYIEARNPAGIFQYEHRIALRATYKFPVKGFELSHRSQYEYRIRKSGNSWRYRPALIFEKELPKSLIPKAKFFITEELFYISTTNRFSRNRFSVGISKEIDKHLTVEVYYLRQNDGQSKPGDLNVLGTTWKIHLQ